MKFHSTQAEDIVVYLEQGGFLDFDGCAEEQECRALIVRDIAAILRKDEDEFFKAVNESFNAFDDYQEPKNL